MGYGENLALWLVPRIKLTVYRIIYPTYAIDVPKADYGASHPDKNGRITPDRVEPNGHYSPIVLYGYVLANRTVLGQGLI